MCVSNKIEKILNLCVGKCGLWFEALLVVSKTRKLKEKNASSFRLFQAGECRVFQNTNSMYPCIFTERGHISVVIAVHLLQGKKDNL